MAQESQGNVDHDPGDKIEDGLEGVEADESLFVERFHYQKHNRRNDGHVGERAGDIIGKSSAGRCNNAGGLYGTSTTLRTGRSIRNLGSTGCTKSHGGLLGDDRHVIRTLAMAQWRRSGGVGEVADFRFWRGRSTRLCPTARLLLSFQLRILNPAEPEFASVIFCLLKGTDDHYCFGTAAIGHIADDANARCGRDACALR